MKLFTQVIISMKLYLNSMHENLLLILTTNVICILLILNTLTLILEMCCSINTALHSVAVNVSPCLTVVWKKFIQHGEQLYAVQRVTLTTHCKLLPHLANCMDIELQFSRMCMIFIKMDMNSFNCVVKTITNMGIYGLHSVMGDNKRFLQF